jgi:hypothetical protein
MKRKRKEEEWIGSDQLFVMNKATEEEPKRKREERWRKKRGKREDG